MNFNAFEQSPFLQSLGWAIANNVWQAGICWGLYYIVISSYSGASAKVKNNVSTIFLFSTFLWFAVTFFNKFIYLQNNIPRISPKKNILSTPVSSVSGNFNFQTIIHAGSIMLPYLSVGYLVLLLIFTAKLINSYRNTIFIRYNGLREPGTEWKLFVEKEAGHMGMTKKIKLWFSRHVDVPATVGFFKPVILIPIASLNQLTSDQLEAILLHELSHIKRNDYLINLLISLIETILFFNPFIVLLSKIIKKERENCCDDFVLQYQYDKHSYASALLSLEKYRIQNLPLALTATSDKKQLLFRIKRIMEAKNNSTSLNYGQKLMALLLTTTIFCSLAWLSPSKKLRQSHDKQSSETPRGTKHEIDKERDIFLGSTAQTTNSLVPEKIIREKPAKLKILTGKNDVLQKNDDNLLIRKPNVTEPNERLLDEYNNKVISAPNNFDIPEESEAADNFFLFPKISPGFTLSEDLNLNTHVERLLGQMEKSKLPLSLMNWKTIPIEVFEKLKNIEIPEFKIINKNNQIALLVNKAKKDNTKNKQDEEFQFSLIYENKNNDTTTLHVIRNSRDFISSKDINIGSNNSDKNFFYERQNRSSAEPSSLPKKSIKIIKVPRPPVLSQGPTSFNKSTEISNYFKPGEKNLSSKTSIDIDSKNEIVTINGKKISFSDMKKPELRAIIGKLLLDCNKPVVKQTADL